MLKTWREPGYQEQARKMIDSMFSDKTSAPSAPPQARKLGELFHVAPGLFV